MRKYVSLLLLAGMAAACGAFAPAPSWARGSAGAPAPARVAPHRYAVVVEALPNPHCMHDVEAQFLAIPGVDAVSTDTVTVTITVTMRPGASLGRAAAANAAGKAGLVMRDFRVLAQGSRPRS